MKEISLDEIIDSQLLAPKKGHPHRVAIKVMMERAICEALDIASEEAEILDKETGISWTGVLDGDSTYEVCKKSILDIKNRVK